MAIELFFIKKRKHWKRDQPKQQKSNDTNFNSIRFIIRKRLTMIIWKDFWIIIFIEFNVLYNYFLEKIS